MVALALCRRRCACGSNRRQQRQHPWWRALAAKESGTHTPNCPAAEDPKTVLPRDDPYTWPHFGGAFPVGTIPRALNCPAAEAPLPPIPDIPFIFWPRFGGAFSCPHIGNQRPRSRICFGAEDEELSASKHRISAPPPTQAGLFLDPNQIAAWFHPLMSRINLWTVIAILLVLFAVTRYLMHEREALPICAVDPSAPACQR